MYTVYIIIEVPKQDNKEKAKWKFQEHNEFPNLESPEFEISISISVLLGIMYRKITII